MSAIYLSCAWLLGMALGARFSLPLFPALLSAAPLALLFFVPHRKKAVILSSLCALVFFGGAWYSGYTHRQDYASDLRAYNNCGTVEVKGLVSREPEIGARSTRVRLSASYILVEGEWQVVSGTALLFVPRYPEHRYGHVLKVKGSLEGRPSDPSVSAEWADYWEYLVSQDIHSVMSYPAVEVLEEGKGAPLLTWIYAVRNRMAQTLAMVLPEPHASLAQGITLGLRSGIPATLRDDFARTGTAHLLAISGIHLTILAGMLVTLTTWLFGRRHFVYIWVTLGIIWLYALLTGLNPPVLRSATMLSFFLAADLFGRQRSGAIALFLAAALIVGASPKVIGNASFQMSFMAMAGLIFISPPLQALGRSAVERVTGESRARTLGLFFTDSLAISVAAVVATWPLIAHYFGFVSWVGIPATVIAMPAVPAVVLTGLLAGGIGLAFLPVGQALGWLAWLPLSYLLLTVSGFASIPGVSYETGRLPPAAAIAYYAALALLLVGYDRREKLADVAARATAFVTRIPWKWVIPPLAALAMVVWLVVATLPDDRLRVSVLDVGHGDAILIARGRHQVLVDGGPDPAATLQELSQRVPFWDRTIEMVVLTHPHADHLAGQIEVLKRYRVPYILSGNVTGDAALLAEWLKAADTSRAKRLLAESGLTVAMGDRATISVLNPLTPALTGTGSDMDNNAVVLMVEMGRVRFLLTSDIRLEAEMALIARRAGLHSTVLKVAHHGSASSTGEGFLTVANPRIAVISAGRDNPYGHPSDAVLARLTQQLGPGNIFRTDRDGTVDFITDGERLWLRTKR